MTGHVSAVAHLIQPLAVCPVVQAEVAAKGEQLHTMSVELRQAQEEAADKAKAAEEALAALKAGQVGLVSGRGGCSLDCLVWYCSALLHGAIGRRFLCCFLAGHDVLIQIARKPWLCCLQAVMDRNRTSVQDELADLKEGLRLVGRVKGRS